MKTGIRILLGAGAALAGWTAPIWAQDQRTDPRWLAFLGCWQSSAAAAEWVCVTPAPEEGASAVDLVTVAGGKVTARGRIVATGQRRATTHDGCTGWETAEWSAQGQRVYLHGAYTCGGGVQREVTGLLAMLPGGEWLRVQGAIVAGQTGLRVLRFREPGADQPAPSDVVAVPPADAAAVSDARLAAAAPLGTQDVIEASRHVDGAVLEAWLAERGTPFTLDAKQLLTLADASVPDRVIDVMVAVSYPRAFERRVAGGETYEGGRGVAPWPRFGAGTFGMPDAFCYGPYPRSYYAGYDCSPFSFGFAGYNGGWYPGGYPLVIVLSGGAGAARPHGRVVNGRGYDLGDGGTSRPGAFPRDPVPAGGKGGTGGTGSSSGSSSSSSGGGEPRTAKPRPPT